ncbi:hypothetical protein [Maledivibacter halophilus]|uniref:Uncharacterized protein n=1 Tax=Maledivibacter halophilus TaxID=36842 RepID=A0A1T5KGY4_9FIRM|nr:hypothetical protein [Maledivibacter halophilus]SKC62618.1 hypothetical protein SAMN02194393_01770 [Maledivibacter halophilus]
MTFTKNSALVKNVWVPLILAGIYTEDQIPVLGNLKEVVEQVIAENE